jgi:hypothetical protein
VLHLPKRGTLASGDWGRRRENLEKRSTLGVSMLPQNRKNGAKTAGLSLPLTLAPGNFTLDNDGRRLLV